MAVAPGPTAEGVRLARDLRRARRAPRLATGLLLAALAAQLLISTGFGPPTLIESDAPTTPVSPSTLSLLRADRPPPVSAKAAVLVDAESGQLLYGKNAHDRRAPASTTKMMTALVVLQNTRLDDVVGAGPDVKLVEPSIIGLDPGDQLTVEQMLYGMLLPSGNDAAVALAQRVAGSIPRFADMMNAEAARLGLVDTRFVNPHGLDVEGHYSSAFDLAMIARAALQNPTFQKIVGTSEYRIQQPIRWYFKNINPLLGSYPGADGVKTGYTDNAGRCLVFSATRNGRRAIAVVLDSADVGVDASTLMDFFFADYTWQTLSVSGNPLTDLGRENASRPTVSESSPAILYPVWQTPYLRSFFSQRPGAIRGSGPAGLATYWLAGKKVAEIELYDAPAPVPSAPAQATIQPN